MKTPKDGDEGRGMRDEIDESSSSLIPHPSSLVPHLAEVIAADSSTFEAECRQLYGAPAFGSFVRVDGAERSVFGVVAHIATAAIDPGRHTQALHLPPYPPEIHRFVHACTPAEVESLTREPDFLRILAAAPHAPVEDLLAGAVLHAAAARGSGAPANRFMVECGRSIATLFRRDPDRLQSIMHRIQAARRATAAAPWERPIDLV